MTPIYDKFKKQVHIVAWGQVCNQFDSRVWNKVIAQVAQSRDQVSIKVQDKVR